jgi:uncharacterized lipoprotein NlpE involved in copper resistance
MQIAYTSKNGLQLPESMGYGFIDKQSIVETDNQLIANYVSQISQKLVHTVTWDAGGCELETFNSNGTRSRLPLTDLSKKPFYLMPPVGIWVKTLYT